MPNRRFMSCSGSTSPIISLSSPMPGMRPITFCSGPSLPICESCLRKSSSVNSPLREPLFLQPHFFLVEFLLGFFDEREQVALAEDAAGHAVGVELFERVEVLAGADELDRHAGDLLDGEGRAAAGVAVELRHDDAVELELLVEDLGAVDGVLAGHAVDDQVHLLRRDLAVDALELAHQLVVDVQPAGRVEDHDVGVVLLGFADGRVGDGDRDLCCVRSE